MGFAMNTQHSAVGVFQGQKTIQRVTEIRNTGILLPQKSKITSYRRIGCPAPMISDITANKKKNTKAKRHNKAFFTIDFFLSTSLQ
jgi:hypothetical protein